MKHEHVGRLRDRSQSGQTCAQEERRSVRRQRDAEVGAGRRPGGRADGEGRGVKLGKKEDRSWRQTIGWGQQGKNTKRFHPPGADDAADLTFGIAVAAAGGG